MEPLFPFTVELATRGRGGLTRELHQQIRQAIVDGRLAAGVALPSTRRVAATLGVARNTVIAAYDLLFAEGYLAPRRGANAIVARLSARPVAAARRIAASRAKGAYFNPLWRDVKPEAPSTQRGEGFYLGVPEHREFPHEAWRRINARALRRSSKAVFAYADPAGHAPLREAIAQHVAVARAVACTSEDVVVVSGAQQAFDLLARLLATPGRTKVAIEDPGYPPLRRALAAAGAQLAPAPVDEQGVRVDQLAHDARIICVTPSHQFPTGVPLSLERRTALLQFAREHDALIIEDDYDGEYRYGSRPLDALQTLDREGRVFYVGTFSKVLFPELRKGFVIAPAWARRHLIALKQYADWHCDVLSQAVLAEFIREGHLARHVRRMQSIYAERRTALLAALHEHLADVLEPVPNAAGLHLAARLNAPAARLKLDDAALPAGVRRLEQYAFGRPRMRGLVFGYGVASTPAIEPAIAAAARGLRSSLRAT